MGNFSMLPGDIVFNILTRLPTELVLECKLVSKSWNKIISYPSFSKSHLNTCLMNLDSSCKFTFLIHRPNQFTYFEYYEDNSSDKPPFHRFTRMKLHPYKHFYIIAGTCNGLVCLHGSRGNKWLNYEPVYICNPITKECVLLPELERTGDRGEQLVTRFGYVSLTNEYKVVRMYYLLREPAFVRVEVYTLGSGKGWRDTGKKFENMSDLLNNSDGVLVNERLYWLLEDNDTYRLVAFDLADENFLNIPADLPPLDSFRLGVLGGYLSASYYDLGPNVSDLYLLKKKKEDGSLCWTKEFSLRNTYTHLALALSGRGTVLCHSCTKIQSHDLNSSSPKLIEDFGGHQSIYQVFPHMNTLVSLKALGEENTKTLETVDAPREVIEEHT